jgi:type I site-specific restriction endonuclease
MAANIILQKLIENERENLDIPAYWQYRDLESFGLDWKLFPYQKNAVNNTIALLYKLYKEGGNNSKELVQLYRNNGLDTEIEKNISIEKENDNFKFLSDYYKCESKISFEKLVNRAAYWMATGSGKTLVMIKLLAVLADLINKKLIPQKDILILAPKDDILNQIKDHVDKFNKGSEITINLRNIKEYERVKNQQSIFAKNEITIFYYRADNISSKDMVAKKKDGKRLDYESIYNNGNWYLILDEAHKGEKETSKRQQFYLALTHNGFLFNFSATFTDDLDKVTTIFDYKLDIFLKDGYGRCCIFQILILGNLEGDKRMITQIVKRKISLHKH